MSVELFKDGDRMAIQTDCPTEEDFLEQLSILLAELIEKGEYFGDWQFQLNYWLPQLVEVCCAYRGYKTKTRKHTIITSGNHESPLTGPSHAYRQDNRPEDRIEGEFNPSPNWPPEWIKATRPPQDERNIQQEDAEAAADGKAWDANQRFEEAQS